MGPTRTSETQLGFENSHVPGLSKDHHYKRAIGEIWTLPDIEWYGEHAQKKFFLNVIMVLWFSCCCFSSSYLLETHPKIFMDEMKPSWVDSGKSGVGAERSTRPAKAGQCWSWVTSVWDAYSPLYFCARVKAKNKTTDQNRSMPKGKNHLQGWATKKKRPWKVHACVRGDTNNTKYYKITQ